MMQKKKTDVRYLTQLGLLAAIVLVMAFTPLGYLKTGGIEITFIMIPVAVGAIMLGPKAGGILGSLFGLTSFIQCFMGSALGVMLLGVDPVRTFILCFVPRVLTGVLAGLIFRAVQRVDKTGVAGYAVGCVSAAACNTLLFVSGFGLLFYQTALGMAGQGGVSVFGFLLTFISLNSILEIVACLVVGTAVCKALGRAFGKKKTATQA